MSAEFRSVSRPRRQKAQRLLGGLGITVAALSATGCVNHYPDRSVYHTPTFPHPNATTPSPDLRPAEALFSQRILTLAQRAVNDAAGPERRDSWAANHSLSSDRSPGSITGVNSHYFAHDNALHINVFSEHSGMQLVLQPQNAAEVAKAFAGRRFTASDIAHTFIDNQFAVVSASLFRGKTDGSTKFSTMGYEQNGTFVEGRSFTNTLGGYEYKFNTEPIPGDNAYTDVTKFTGVLGDVAETLHRQAAG